jgi:hypothetical protein
MNEWHARYNVLVTILRDEHDHNRPQCAAHRCDHTEDLRCISHIGWPLLTTEDQ